MGDKVWARNEKTGTTELRRVTNIAPQHFDQLMELHIEGEAATLKATPSHPFRARRDAGDTAHWINAGDLIAGEQIETQGGRWATILSVSALDKPAVVYNFTVEQDHDYFVGDEGLLVHNGGPGYIVTPNGTVIPTDPNELLNNLQNLTDTSTNPTSSRKFVGQDSEGPMRIRIEQAHPDDPTYTGPEDPLHTVDHMHIDRRANGSTGPWGSDEKIPCDWPF